MVSNVMNAWIECSHCQGILKLSASELEGHCVFCKTPLRISLKVEPVGVGFGKRFKKSEARRLGGPLRAEVRLPSPSASPVTQDVRRLEVHPSNEGGLTPLPVLSPVTQEVTRLEVYPRNEGGLAPIPRFRPLAQKQA